MKVLVTGCCGYIGSMLCEKLLNVGYEVVGVDNLYFNNYGPLLRLMPNMNFSFHKLDVGDTNGLMKVCNGVNTVYWLAAYVGQPLCDTLHEEEVKRVNYESFKNFIKLCPIRTLYCNTNSGYGTSGEDICTEESPLKPISLYGTTKCDSEKALLDRGNGVSLRLATVFGLSLRPRFDLLVNDWTREITLNRFIKIYEPNFKRNYVHIVDVVSALAWLTNPKYNGIYNVGLDSANCTKLELANTILNNTIYPDYIPPHSIEIFEGKDKDQRNYFVSSDKLKKTGFSFHKTLEDGIKEVSKFVHNINRLAYSKEFSNV